MIRPLRFLVLDAYPRSGREALSCAGATAAGALYARVIRQRARNAVIDIMYPADADAALPAGASLAEYDGAVWTGSSLTVYQDDPRVHRQIDLARAIFAAGVPSFGSCWAAQVSVVAAGGSCAANPKGREFGVSRCIALSGEGRIHPLYAGKPAVFDAFSSHADEVAQLSLGATVLAQNDFSPVQAVAVTRGRGTFWAVQYHPEYDEHEIACLCVMRAEELVAQGTFASPAAAQHYADQLESLHRDPARDDIARALGIPDALRDPEQRTIEVRNWIERLVKPLASAR